MMSMITQIQAERLAALRERIPAYINGKRLIHTLGVEREITSLAGIYMPEREFELRCAALLHDITKQLSLDEQLSLCDAFGIEYTERDKLTPKIFHAMTAVGVIRRDFPEFADEFVLSAVRYHTTGRAGMTLGEKLLYLADYIEDTRTFPDCVELRRHFYSALGDAVSQFDRDAVLRDTLILSFDMTIRGLIEDGTPIARDTFEARNYLIEEQEFEKRK